jgi:hypothetical protein
MRIARVFQRYSMGRLSNSRRMPGELIFGKAINGDDAHMLPSDARLDPSVEVLAGQKFIQVARNVRQGEGMIFAAHATPQIAQEAIMHLREAVVVSDRQIASGARFGKLAEHVFEYVHPVREAFEICSAVRLALCGPPPSNIQPFIVLRLRAAEDTSESGSTRTHSERPPA